MSKQRKKHKEVHAAGLLMVLILTGTAIVALADVRIYVSLPFKYYRLATDALYRLMAFFVLYGAFLILYFIIYTILSIIRFFRRKQRVVTQAPEEILNADEDK